MEWFDNDLLKVVICSFWGNKLRFD